MVNSEFTFLNILKEAKSTYKNAVVYFHRLKSHGISHEQLDALQQAIEKTEEIFISRRYGISGIELSGEIHSCIRWGELLKAVYRQMVRNDNSMTDEFPYQLFTRAKYDSDAMTECMKKLILLASKHEEKLAECGFSPVRIDDGMALLTELKQKLSIWGKGVELHMDDNECINEYIDQLIHLTTVINEAGSQAFQSDPALHYMFKKRQSLFVA